MIKLNGPIKITNDEETKTYWIDAEAIVDGDHVKISGGTSALNEDARLDYTVSVKQLRECSLSVINKLEQEETQREIMRLIWAEIMRKEASHD